MTGAKRRAEIEKGEIEYSVIRSIGESDNHVF